VRGGAVRHLKFRDNRSDVQGQGAERVRAIKITYRAVFQQPIGLLNPMGLGIPGAISVEIFQRGETWQARSLETEFTYVKLGRFASADHGRTAVGESFQECLEPWQAWGKPPNELEPRMLTPYDIADLGESRFAWIEDEDRTHIIHQPSLPPGQRVPSAACGASVPAKCFINNLANVEPTCKGCAEVWKEHYTGLPLGVVEQNRP
jgi:hypothetical protein